MKLLHLPLNSLAVLKSLGGRIRGGGIDVNRWAGACALVQALPLELQNMQVMGWEEHRPAHPAIHQTVRATAIPAGSP